MTSTIEEKRMLTRKDKTISMGIVWLVIIITLFICPLGTSYWNDIILGLLTIAGIFTTVKIYKS